MQTNPVEYYIFKPTPYVIILGTLKNCKHQSNIQVKTRELFAISVIPLRTFFQTGLEKKALTSFIVSMMNFTGTALTCIRSERIVFQKLAFSVTASEILYLTGPNGSGKSSLLRMMAGLMHPVEGHFFWNGERVSKVTDAFRGNIYYVGHQNAVKGDLSVRENVQTWAALYDSEMENYSVDHALEAFELDSLANLPARFLSAGQKRRLNLARLNTTGSPLWLLDEPTTSLDEAGSLCLKELISSHIGKGGMVVMATHETNLTNCKVLDLSEFTLDPT